MPDAQRLFLLERIADRVDSFIAYLDTDLRYVYCNAQYSRFFGLAAEDQRGTHVRDVVGEDRWREVKERYYRALEGEGSSTVSSFPNPSGGPPRWGKVDFTPDWNANGQVIGLFVLVSNVTELKRSERELEIARQELEQRVVDRTRELRARETQLRAITDAVPAGIGFFDADQRCAFINRTLSRWLAVDSDDVVGRRASEFLPAEVLEPFGGAPKPSGFEQWSGEADFGNEDCSRPVEFHVVPQESQDALSGFYLLGYDLTQRQAEEQHHRSMHLRMVESQRRESFALLARGLAHDFNNALQSISGNLDLASRFLEEDSAQRRFIDNAHTSAQQAQEFCTELTAYSGRSSARQTPLNFAELCTEAIEVIKSQPDHECKVVLTTDDAIPLVRGNRTQLKRVLLNLLVNAVQADRSRSGLIQVHLSSISVVESKDVRPVPLDADEYLVCEVADQGIGMDDVAQERLFEPFFTTKSDGRGLGLAAVMSILRGHKGGIEVASKPGSGTKVRVYLRAFDHASRVEMPEASAPWMASGLAMVVDDDRQVLEASAEILRQCGFDVFSASSGAQALRVAEGNHDLKLVLLDLLMPGLSGHETFKGLRELRPQLPIIINSGFPERAEEILARDRTALLQKPWFPDDLKAVAAELLAD